MTSVTGIPSSGGKSWNQPLTRPGALTDRPQGQRVNLAQPLGNQSARPRSPVALEVAPVSSLPRGGPSQTMAGACDKAPDFLSPSGNQVLGPALGSMVTLNCTALVVSGPHCPLPSVQWLKDGLLLSNGSIYDLHEDAWVKANWSEVLVSSVLGINLTGAEDFGTFTCSIQNISSSSFTLWRAGLAGHVAAVLASLLVLLALLLVALLYVKCRLNVLLWYQDKYGEVEMNDGKLYDAYISYSDSPEDRKFVNFILKPQLERHRGYKLFLDDRDLLPRAEPSADLLVNLSRCRRLVVVLSDAFLGRAWCSHSFREGLCRLLELTRRPIFITFEGQRRDPAHPALRLLRQHRHLVTLLLWKPGSVTPSSDFWKELRLALPRKVQYRSMEGDPQTRLQDDKDPMLIVRGRLPEGRTLDPELDPDPEGDLGVRGPVFGEPPALPHASAVSLGEGRGSEVDVSDLGSRNYSARTDFYCLLGAASAVHLSASALRQLSCCWDAPSPHPVSPDQRGLCMGPGGSVLRGKHSHAWGHCCVLGPDPRPDQPRKHERLCSRPPLFPLLATVSTTSASVTWPPPHASEQPQALPPHAPQKPIPQLQTLVPSPVAQAFTLHVDRAPARGPWAILNLLLQAGW